jgi:hypothetical protein
MVAVTVDYVECLPSYGCPANTLNAGRILGRDRWGMAANNAIVILVVIAVPLLGHLA